MIIINRKFQDAEILLPKSGVAGFFTIRKLKAGRVLHEIGPFQNMVVDNGLNRLGNQQVSVVYTAVHVGTGTTPPDPADTSLANFLAGANMGAGTQSFGGAPDYYSSRNTVTLFAVGAVVGNITEVGIAGSSTNANLFARALIVDGEGNPIAITVLADEQLEVTYQLRHYPPLVDVPATVNVGPNSHDTIARALAANSAVWCFPNPSGTNQAFNSPGNTSSNQARWWSGALAALTATTPAGTSKVISGLPVDAYSGGSFQKDFGSSSNPANGAATCRTLSVQSNCCAFQVEYDPVVSKTADQTCVLWTRFSWGRYSP